MKFDSWTKYNKMEHNVLLMAEDAKKTVRKYYFATKRLQTLLYTGLLLCTDIQGVYSICN